MFSSKSKAGAFRTSLFVMITLFIVVLLLEIVAQLIGSGFQNENYAFNKIEAKHKNMFRVLALGESTTSSILGGPEGAWPELLEKMLNENDIQTKVYNTGAPGLYSGYMVEQLPAWIDKFKPDLVIGMIGINDLNYLSPLEKSWFEKLLSGSKLFQILGWMQDSTKEVEHIFIDKKLNQKEDILLQNLLEMEEKKYAQLSVYKSKVQDWENFVITYFMRRFNAIEMIGNKLNIKNGKIFSEHLLRDFPDSHFVLEVVLEFHSLSALEKECIETTKSFIERGNNIGPRTLNIVGYCLSHELDEICPHGELSCLDKRKQYIKKTQAFIPRFNGEGINLDSNLAKISQTVKNQGLNFIFMQYPTMKLSEMHLNLAAKYKINLLENHENFVQALKQYKYEEVFVDRFAETWGHTTPLGHELIAKNVLEYLLSKPELIQRRK